MAQKNKKDLAKMAAAAILLACSLPTSGHATDETETAGTVLAGGGCAASQKGCAASQGCGATPSSTPGAYRPNQNYNANYDTTGSSQGYRPAGGSYDTTNPGPGYRPAGSYDTTSTNPGYRPGNPNDPNAGMGTSSNPNYRSNYDSSGTYNKYGR